MLKDMVLAGKNPSDAAVCLPGTLDTAKVTGKIVVCDRGAIARFEKSLVVKQAGGVGMVLVNVSPNSLDADLHFVPTVHLPDTNRAAILRYIANQGTSASATLAHVESSDPAPLIADFSSRGPSLATGDQLKPDISAPGVNVVAAVAPPNNFGRLFDVYSGTSMASPHIAGIAALLKQAHSDWSPAMIKSALMTTAYDLLDTNDPFAQGAGHVKPNSAVNPGLVYDSGPADWIAFLCGVGQLSGCAQPIDPSDLNLASIAIGDLAGFQTVIRTVKNVGSQSEKYTANISGLSGINVEVTPTTFTVAPGATATYTVKFTRAKAPLGSYAKGFLTWTGDNGHSARSPIVIRPVALAAPAQVSGSGGSISYNVRFGYDGSFSATPRGLIPANITPGTVTQDPDQTFDPANTAGTVSIQMAIPAGTTYARFALFDADVAAGSDIDLYVYQGSTLVGISGSNTSAEEVNLANPAAGNYTAYIHGWGLPSGSSPFKLHTWLVGSASAGNMTVSVPAKAVLGTTGTVNLSFSSLAAGTKYLGSVAYSNGTSSIGTTILRVDTP